MAYPDKPSEGSVLHWREGGIAHLRFNRPQALNAIDVDMATAFGAACEDIAGDPAVRVVWMSAEGRAFMAGGDIASMAADPVPVADRLIAGMHGGLQALAGLDAPVVASVHGAVAGAGLGVMLGASDLVIAAEGTRFSVAYPLIGASCDCSTSWSLPRLVGLRKALELALLSDTVSSDEALRLGLCNRVLPPAELEAESRKLVERLVSGPTRAFGRIRRLMRASMASTLSDQLEAEAEGFRACAATSDFAEGACAFLAKRPARFSGQ
ncbi:enoyl-CoA hydratase/isomerase family protein [Variovorax sp. KK3]|uniref:enoyl-CoA hydratase/isomerase family protein n=1 Tax=Variovorax sp. KK3 TaxID=1855728 RepID=UPI00097C8382|nr:enoyl-CoA hydratase-related protein [Variovorax sp. KK3]